MSQLGADSTATGIMVFTLKASERAFFWGGCQDIEDRELSIGDWHFFAASYHPGGIVTLFVDGTATVHPFPALATILTDVWIGAETLDNGASFRSSFVGAIDDVRIYNRALSPEELELLYTVGNSIPAVISTGEPQTAASGSNFELTVNTVGAAPLFFQWYQDGELLPGATNATLSLIEVEASDAGAYRLMLSNRFGVVWSPAIPLTVLPPLDVNEVLDVGLLGFALRDRGSWQADTAVVRVGQSSLSSGVLGHGEATTVATFLRGPGELGFWWRVSSELGFDRFECWMDGTRVSVISGEQPWQDLVLTLPPGPHQVRWTFRRDPSGDGGQNRAWLDGLRFIPGPDAPDTFSLTQPRLRRRDGLLSAILNGPPGVYEAQLSADAREWAPWFTVTNETGHVELRWPRPEGGEPRFLRVWQP